MRRLGLLAFVVLLFVTVMLPVVSSASAFFIPQDSNYSIKFSCALDGGFCDSGVSCNLTIEYPNSTILLDNVAATNLDNGFFNYTLTQNETQVNGEHQAHAYCYTSTNSLNASSDFIYEVNPSGIRSSEQRTDSLTRAIWFMAFIGGLFFLGFIFSNQKFPVKATYILFAVIFFLIALNLLTVGLKGEVVDTKLEVFFDGFTAVAWYAYWFLFAIIIVMWIFVFIVTMAYKNLMRNATRYGGDIQLKGLNNM